MLIALVGVAALFSAGGLIAYFLKLEGEGRRHVVVIILFSFLLAEMVLQRDALSAGVGIFRIPLGTLDARPADIIVPPALAARALTAKVPRQISIAALLWTSFIIAYAAAAPFGVMSGNPLPDVVGQLRGVLLGAGIMILVAGIDVQKLVANDRIPRIGRVVGSLGAVLILTHFSGLSVSLDVPIVGFRALGALGADARTLFPILGAIVIIVELVGGRRRLSVIVPSLALVAAPLAATQGGPYLSLLVLLLTLMFASLGATWKRRLSLTAGDIGFVLAIVLGGGAASIFLSGGETPVVLDQFEEAVLSDSQATTTGERYQLWDDATAQIMDSPVWGGGLGVKGTIDRRFPLAQVSTTFHNIMFDIAARSGLAGLGLFLAALTVTFSRAISTWRRANDPLVAALAVTSMAGVVAILGRGLVSSSLEQTRITAVLFLLIGLVLACSRTVDAEPNPDQLPRNAEAAVPTAT